MSKDATARTVLIYGDGKMAKMIKIALITAGCEVSVVPTHDISIIGATMTTTLFDDLVPTEPPQPVTQRVYGPQRKGRGGKLRRW